MPNKLSYSIVKSYIESFGYSLISKVYTNNSTKLLMRCPDDHSFSMIFNSFQNGRRCSVCFGTHKYSYEYVRNFINKDGYTLLSDSYKNNRTKLLVKCDKDHEYEVTFGNFISGFRCPICVGNKRHTYDHTKSYIESFGYQLLSSDYKNTKTKLTLRCMYGHKFNMMYNAFKAGNRCPICNANNKSSKGERDLASFIRSLGINVICNDRTQIVNPKTGYNLELDIWIPSTRKAIEYNGMYWHSHFNKITNDYIKKHQCLNNNISLLIVNEYNWLNNQESEKQIIRNFINEV